MKKQNGFTLLELLVVIALIIIIVSSSIGNYDKMGRHIELENAAYNMALTVREAQVYGINKQARRNGAANFGENYRYGVYFNKTQSVFNVSKTKFIIYLDRSTDTDVKFTSAGGLNCTGDVNDECYSQVLLTKGNHISAIYFHDGSDWIPENKDIVDISFVRPNPDAIIVDNTDTSYSKVRIVIQDATNTITKCIDIGIAGDFAIKNNENCDVN